MAVARMQYCFFLLTVFLILASVAQGNTGTATYYNLPYTPSACYGYRKSGVMIGAASKALWNNRGACGKKFRVKCLGATNARASYPCKPNKEVVITIVDYCPRCGGTIDLSRDAFNSIAHLSAGRISIDFLQTMN